MDTILDVINGISQALSSNYDGATDKDGEPVKSGLKREDGNPIFDPRVMDGFNARIQGETLVLTYNLETKIKEVHNTSFESDIESTMADLAKHLKKEYKSATGSALQLTKDGEVDILVQYISKIRTSVTAVQKFKLASSLLAKEPERKLDDTFKKFLELGGKAKRPQNDKSKSDNYKQFDPFNVTTGQRNSDLK